MTEMQYIDTELPSKAVDNTTSLMIENEYAEIGNYITDNENNIIKEVLRYPKKRCPIMLKVIAGIMGFILVVGTTIGVVLTVSRDSSDVTLRVPPENETLTPKTGTPKTLALLAENTTKSTVIKSTTSFSPAWNKPLESKHLGIPQKTPTFQEAIIVSSRPSGSVAPAANSILPAMSSTSPATCNCDSYESLRRDVIKIIASNAESCEYIRIRLNQKYKEPWQCFSGTSEEFGYSITYDNNHFVRYQMGALEYIVFRTRYIRRSQTDRNATSASTPCCIGTGRTFHCMFLSTYTYMYCYNIYMVQLT
ncbi:unnamed protein product [Owenia fusiformis]|uniref:Uncharacterized protein n=1 Tax=Owenia fusiformis TaxID=6347 RepID=A0A8S4NU21_OWEFU|nr:unnamed protein product [Owenia fusiformis]